MLVPSAGRQPEKKKGGCYSKGDGLGVPTCAVAASWSPGRTLLLGRGRQGTAQAAEITRSRDSAVIMQVAVAVGVEGAGCHRGYRPSVMTSEAVLLMTCLRPAMALLNGMGLPHFPRSARWFAVASPTPRVVWCAAGDRVQPRLRQRPRVRRPRIGMRLLAVPSKQYAV